MVFGENIGVKAKLPPSIKRISNMYVNSEIVELSLVRNSQIPIIGFLSITSKYQESGHWVFNPFLYIRVKDKISELLQYKFPLKLVKSSLFRMMWSFVASNFAADHFWLRPILGTTTLSLIISTFY